MQSVLPVLQRAVARLRSAVTWVNDWYLTQTWETKGNSRAPVAGLSRMGSRQFLHTIYTSATIGSMNWKLWWQQDIGVIMMEVSSCETT